MNTFKHIIKIGLYGLLLISASAQAMLETTTFIHTDHLGSPVMATNEDGSVKWREDYEPFGKQLTNQDTDSIVGYTGHMEDKSLDLTYMQARWYHAEVGRFMSLDPIGYRDIHSFNRYAYANNNPYKYVDPDGRFGLVIHAFQRDLSMESAMEASRMGTYSAVAGVAAAAMVADTASNVISPMKGNIKQVVKETTASKTSKGAFRNAKEANDIPRSAQPDLTIKPNSPEGKELDLDSRNKELFEFTNNKGDKIHIRHDKPVTYGQGGKGDQGGHFNAGPKGEKLKQHHNY